MKNKIVIFGPFPPPMHGVSYLLSEFVNFCEKKSIVTKVIKTSPERNEHSFNNFSIATFILMLKLICSAVYTGVIDKKSIVYFNIATKGIALYRDLVLGGIFRLFRAQLFIHIHGTELSDFNPFIKKIIKFSFKGACFIYVSEPLKVEHIWLNKIARTVHVVPNGCEDLLKQQDTVNFTAGINILFFSNFYHQKGVKEFLSVLSELVANDIKFSAVMCGSYTSDYPEAMLKECISSLHLNNKLTLYGPTYGELKTQVFNDADILLFPSHKESFGNVMIEAMSAKTLVVASETTSTSYILDSGNSGYFTSNFVVKEIVEFISTLNETTHQTLVTNARDRYLMLFNINSFNQRLLEVLGGKC